jgi:hypothetical protein
MDLKHRGGAEPAAVQPATDKKSKLIEMKSRFDEGLIDADEYKEAKTALLLIAS